MQTPGPGTGEENGERNGTPAGTSQEANREPGTSGQESDRGHDTSEETPRETDIADSTNQETAGEPGTTNEGDATEITAAEPGTANREGETTEMTAGEPDTTNQEGDTAKMTAGEPDTTNQECGTVDTTTGEPDTTNEEGDTTEMTAGEPSKANRNDTSNEEGDTIDVTAGERKTDGDQASNQEGDATDVPTGEAGGDPDTERELGTSESMGVGEGKTGADQDISSEDQKEELDIANLTTGEEEEALKVTDGPALEDPSSARYEEMPSEPPEEQEDTQEAWENEEPKPQEEEDSTPQDSSDDPYEDEEVREALIQQYQSLLTEKEKVQQQNSHFQHKLYEYFRRKKGEDTRPEMEKHVSDQEQRYLKYLATLEEMRKTFREDTVLHEQQIEELRVRCQEVVSEVDKEWAAFQEQKKKVALYVVNRGAGKHAASTFSQEIVQLQAKEERKEKEVIQVRLENIKLKNQINHHDFTLRSKEELAEGLHLIDFEQLKIENQTYNEKIEERNEELLKLRKKITNTVQVLTHLKEKLQFVQVENQDQKDRLMEIEALVAHKRDILTRTKQARDSLRMDNLNLKQKCGLLGNETLLRDFEEKVDATEELRQKLEDLKRRHAELTLSSKGVMKKIQDSKFVLES
ncbi:coiled-coil domain-containing protein 96 [Rana temporaria]|uniref:coiled-coil domain-containing protein 96 n=1 Tax=Rana temporaria TaxID=8407 RepID=UPI001AADEDF2|nr:coiled-coil domain-containing protein 96 [Rana temporaria]